MPARRETMRRIAASAAAAAAADAAPPDPPKRRAAAASADVDAADADAPRESSVWHPNTQMSEWAGGFDEVVRTTGANLTLAGGRNLMNAAGSMWASVWGSPPDALTAALVRQAKRLPHSPLFNLTNLPAERLAARLVTDVAPSMHRALFSDDGSTAMEAAVKMAFMHGVNRGEGGTRTRIAALENGYHGDTLGAMALAGVPHLFGGYGPLLMRGVRRLPSPDSAAPPPGMTAAERSRECLERMHEAFESDPSITALVMESGAQVAGGVVIYPDGFERGASRLCRRFGVTLVLDEVATGLGRLGSMAEHAAQGSRPDIVSYGKMLTGGCLPMAATLATRRVYESFLGDPWEGRHFFHGHTYTGNPLAAAAANANLDLYESEGLLARVRDSSAELGKLLDQYVRPLSQAGTVRHKGMLAGIEMAAAALPPAAGTARRGAEGAGGRGGGGGEKGAAARAGRPSLNRIVYEEGRRRGVYLRTLGNMVMIVPPLATSAGELERMVARTARVVEAAAARLR